MYKRGDWVIFNKPKCSTCPSPRAKDLDPAPQGELYSYSVEKFWVVTDSGPDHTLAVMTRRGKVHRIQDNDPHLRLASWWERLWHRNRFPRLAEPMSDQRPHPGTSMRASA